jgi:hypothetical protein
MLSAPGSLSIVGKHIANTDESPFDDETQWQMMTDSIIPVVWTVRERVYQLGVLHKILSIVESEHFKKLIDLLSYGILVTDYVKSQVIKSASPKSVPAPAPKTV